MKFKVWGLELTQTSFTLKETSFSVDVSVSVSASEDHKVLINATDESIHVTLKLEY